MDTQLTVQLPIQISALYAAIMGLFVIYMAKRVTDVRQVIKGQADESQKLSLNVARRAHGNAIEYIPIALILLALAEMNGWSVYWIHGLGSMFVLARFSHGYGFIKSAGKSSLFRFYGIVFSWVAIITLSILNIISYFQ
jgi:hypothetical protein